MKTTATSYRPHGSMRRIAVAALLVTVSATAETINVDSDGVAIHGYDPVAYFTDGRPEVGGPQHTYRWKDAEWRFSSAGHRDAFAQDPERYAPQFGGFCAFATSRGRMVDVDPKAWAIRNGRLYLNHDSQVQGLWELRASELVEDANDRWADMEGEMDR